MPDTHADSLRARNAARKYRFALAAFAVVLVAMQVASTTRLQKSLWGSHLYAFLPMPVAIAAWVILLAATFVLVRRGRPSGAAPVHAPLSTTASVALTVGVTAVSTALFWVLRSRQALLGDAVPLMVDLPGGKAFHPRQPLAMWIQQQLYRSTGGWFRGGGASDQDVAGNAVALGSVAAGAVFVCIAIALGRVLTRGAKAGRAAPWWAALVLMAQGYIVLVFGYVENYSYYLVVVALYLLCALLYLERRVPLAGVAAALAIAVGIHLSSIALAPSFLFLVVVAVRDPTRRIDGVVGALSLVVLTVALDGLLRPMSPGFTLWSGLGDLMHIARATQGGGAGIAYTFSSTHFRDFASELVLIGPLGSLLVIPAAALALADRKLRGNPAALFLIITCACYLAGNWSTSEPQLGYARDWDLFAPAGVCYCATVLFLLLHQAGRARGVDRLLAFALLLSLVHVAPWVWINHSEARSIERFATLPLGGGRTETTLGNHYFRKSDYADAELWFKRALAINKANPDANSLLGRLYGLQGNYELSTKYLGRAVMVRPDLGGFRRDHIFVLLKMKRCREAMPHLLWLAEREPEDVTYWQSVGETMARAGCMDELVMLYRPLLGWLDRYAADNPDDATADVHAGLMLGRINRHAEAAAKFGRALSVNPTDAMALYGLGTALEGMGLKDDARRQMEEFLDLYPDHPQSADAREFLSK